MFCDRAALGVRRQRGWCRGRWAGVLDHVSVDRKTCSRGLGTHSLHLDLRFLDFSGE